MTSAHPPRSRGALRSAVRFGVPACATVTAVALGVPAAAAAPSPPVPVRSAPGIGGPSGLTGLSAERLELADAVAAAKWGTGQSVDDPARERQLLQSVARTSARKGVSPVEAQDFFRDQIEASKVVQRGLLAHWRAHPADRPQQRPDLTHDVRPQLDRLTDRLVAALHRSTPVRHSAGCPAELSRAVLHTAHRQQHSEPLHSAALVRAVRSACHPT